jgi:hypothetical protein
LEDDLRQYRIRQIINEIEEFNEMCEKMSKENVKKNATNK